LGIATNAQAARVTPMALDLEPTGTRSSARIEVTNNEDKQLPVEVRMYKGIIDERGQLDLQPADDDFMVFPPQTLIEPNGQQVFRVQYLPGDVPTQSEVYYASVSQIPVQLPSDQSRIQVVMRFNVLINVVPDGTAPDPHVTSVTPIVQETKLTAQEQTAHPEAAAIQKQPGIEVRIENKGTRYFAAGRTSWSISGADNAGKPYSEDFTAAKMSELIGMGIVAPGRARIFFVPTPDKLADGAKVTIKM
jgi:fimbrial chaperone protein